MKIEINIDPQNSTLVKVMTQLLAQPELWKAGYNEDLRGPHDIYLRWDSFPCSFFYLLVEGERIENVGMIDRWKILRAAKKTWRYLNNVRELEQEKAIHEKLSCILEKLTAAKNTQ